MRKPLPIIEGISPSCFTISGDTSGKTVLEYLGERFPQISVETWLSRIARGVVVDQKGVRIDPYSECRKGTFIYYYRELESETPIPFEETVLYRDDHILVADKPHFLPVVPSGKYIRETLLVRLKKRLGLEFLVPLHRIDRETAGLVIFSHNPKSRGMYASLFLMRRVHKVYEALAPHVRGLAFPTLRVTRIVAGNPFFRMQEVDGEPNSQTRIDLIGNTDEIGRYKLEPLTGRKHQLRLHMSGLGMPILNDRIYPVTCPPGEDNYSYPLKLLAKMVQFTDPLTGRPMYFKSGMELIA